MTERFNEQPVTPESASTEEPSLDVYSFSKRYSPQERLTIARELRDIRSQKHELSLAKAATFDAQNEMEKLALIDDFEESKNNSDSEAVSETLANEEYLNGEIQKRLDEFYKQQSAERDTFLEEGKSRSVSELSKDHQVIFVHTIALTNSSDVSSEAKPGLKTMNYVEKSQCLIGLAPMISTSTISYNRKSDTPLYPFGFVLSEGVVLAAHESDAASRTDKEGRRFFPRLSGEQKIISTDPEGIKDAIHADKYRHNELVVEHPVVGGIFFDANTRGGKYDLLAMGIKRSTERGAFFDDSELLRFRDLICEQVGIPKVKLVYREDGKIREIQDGSEVEMLSLGYEERGKLVEGLFV